jgi:hypothetical protein
LEGIRDNMATLLETLQKRLATPAQAPVAPKINIEEVLQAKKGKAAAPARGIQASAVGEAIAQDVGQQQLEQQQLAGQVQAAQLGEQQAGVEQAQDIAQQQLESQQRQFEAGQVAQEVGQLAGLAGAEQLAQQERAASDALKIEGMNNKAALAIQDLAANRNISRDNIFAQAKAEDKILSERDDASILEQQAFFLAMQDKDYLSELDRIGKQRLLEDEIAFNQEMRSSVFGSKFTEALDAMGFQAGQNVKSRDVKKQMADLTNGQIVELAQSNAKALNQRAVAQGVGTAVSTIATDLAKDEE